MNALNFRVMETELGPVLLFRDTDEAEKQEVVIRFYLDDSDTIITQRLGYPFLTDRGVQDVIANLTEEKITASIKPLIELCL